MKNESEILDEANVGATRWHGALNGIYKQLVYGWAMDRTRPDARVIVEICRDDVPITCVVADVARTDLAAEMDALDTPDLCHGFVADLGMLPASSGGIISARVANTEVTLAGGFRLEESKVPPSTAINSVVGDGGLRLHGWALDPVDQKRTITVRAFVDNEQVAQATANIIHPSMRGYVDGAHGFDLALPPALADGRVHSVRVVDEDGRQLNGSPLTVCCVLDGLTGLLPTDSDPLLVDVADIYQRHLPRSLALSAWPQWSAHFDSKGPAVLPPLSTAVIVSGGDTAPVALERTLASVQDQHGMAVRTFTGAAFPTLLAQAMASGCDVLCCVRAGDTLAPHALAYALEGFTLPGAQLVYTDSEANGRPWLKPAWNPDYALASDYPLDLLLIRATAARDLAETRDAADFAWSALAAAWPQGSDHIVHVPRVLLRMDSPPDVAERAARLAAATRALSAVWPQAVLEELGVTPCSAHAARRIRHPLPTDTNQLSISMVIPTRDRADLLKRCIDTIRRFTDWPKLEIIVIDNGSTEEATHTYFAEISGQGVRVLPMPGPFNYAELNNRAIAQATGDIIGLINNDIEALHVGWLDEMVAQLLRPDVGAVGAKLLWPNGMVQHGGVLLGVGNVAGHFGNRLQDADWGDHGRNQLVQQVSGCTAACLFLRKDDYLMLGGMDGSAFPVAFNDVDLCLKVRAAGKAIVWTPHAKLLHAESASRGHEDTPQKKARAQREVDALRNRWGHILQQDPAYHPSLNLDPNSHAFGGLAMTPRNRSARNGNLTTCPVEGRI